MYSVLQALGERSRLVAPVRSARALRALPIWEIRIGVSLSLSGSLFFSLPLFLAFSIYLLFSFSSLLFVFFGLLQLDRRISFVQIFSSLCLFYLAVFVDFVTGTEVRSLSLKVFVLVKYRAFSVDQID